MAMSAFLKSFFIPLIASAILYALVFHLLIPLYRNHVARYSDYIPVALGSNNSLADTSDLRHRVLDAFRAFLPKFGWLTSNRDRLNDASDDLEGEEELDETVWSSADTTINYQPARPDNARRLSRELEEGFRDSSDDEAGV